ncbi:S-layer homology domain-containing protein [Aquibacillus albus]|uniref:SLH domain-containing protein n=1 Tax=Aquibacillus albus TaxID=1168171 RepID=A0ABS2MZQ8_9BACI|nr:S-layer homology domain-containing protein [Aquibacillus albus]MBM7571367.1 hypothetical protein [Aquibacillus albus]
MSQNKFRKITASSIAATAALAAVAPAAVSADEVVEFSDVAESNSHYPAITTLATEGIIAGYPDGTYKPGNELTRANAAVLFAGALDLELPAAAAVEGYFTDIDASHTYAAQIAAVAEAEIFVGSNGEFGSSDVLTRAQMASTIVNAFGLEDNGEDVDVYLDNVPETHKESVKILVQQGITNQTGDFRPSEAVTRGQFATFLFKALGLEDVTAQPEGPAVEDVEVSGLKQIKVSLTGDVDLEAAGEVDNYTLVDEDDNEIDLADVDVPEASTSSNHIVVTLTLEEDVENQTNATLTVDKAVTGEEFTQDVEFFDTTIPEVTNVSVVGKATVKVSFTESMDFGTLDSDGYVTDSNIRKAFELNDGSVFVKDVKVLKNGTEANVEYYSDLEEGTNSLSVGKEVKDYAGYVVSAGDFEFDVVEDTEAPQLVAVKNVTALKATLVFDEDINDDLDTSDFYHTNTSNTVDSIEEVDGNEVTVKWDDDHALPNGTAYIYVKAEGVQDLWENENDQLLRISADVTVDEDAPEITAIEADGEDAILVTYDEEVSDSALDEDNYTLFDEDGEEVDIDSVEVEDEDDNQYRIVLEEPTTGDFTLEVDGVEDIYGNAIDEETLSVTITDSSAPSISDFTSKLYEDGEIQELVITFDGEKMATTGKYSVLDLDKYRVDLDGLDGNSDEWKTLSDLDGIKIVALDNGEQVKITLDTEEAGYEFVADEDDSIELARVADASGNATSELSGTFDIDEEGTVGLDSDDPVRAISKNEVEIELDGKITELDEDDFRVYYGSDNTDEIEITGKSLDNSGSNSVITFTLAEDLDTDATYNSETVRVVSETSLGGSYEGETVNQFGEQVEFSAEVVADQLAPELHSDLLNDDDDYEVRVAHDDTDDVTEFELKFTEDLEASSSAAAAGLAFDVEGYEFTTASEADLEEGEFTIAIDGATVRVYVYTEDTDEEFEINLDPTRFLVDGDGNEATFQETVTVEVYDEE